MMFSISVPIGAYHPFLPACFESLARQEAAVQIALLDASGDARVRALAERYDAVLAYRRHGPDAGQAAAIMEGWENTDGDLLGWLNADDILFPGALARAAAAMTEGDFDVVYGHSTILDEAGRTTGYHWSVEPPGPRLLESGIISQPSCFFTRAAYDAASGMNADLHYTMDWELFIRLYKSRARFGFIDTPLSMVLWGADTKTAAFNPRRRRELQDIIRAHAPPEKRKKIFRSFAIHNAMERLRPRTVKDAVARALIRGRKVINGLSADGTITDQATLYMAHYEDATKTGLRLEIDEPATVDEIRIDGAIVKAARQDKALLLNAAAPIAPAQTISVNIKAKGAAAVRFRSCGFANVSEKKPHPQKGEGERAASGGG